MNNTLTTLLIITTILASGCTSQTTEIENKPQHNNSTTQINQDTQREQTHLTKYTRPKIQETNNISNLLNIQSRTIEDNKAIIKAKIGAVKSCNLNIKSIGFQYDDKTLTSDVTTVNSPDLCRRDSITLTHTSENFYPHPQGRMDIKLTYHNPLSPWEKRTNNYTIYKGTYHILMRGLNN